MTIEEPELRSNSLAATGRATLILMGGALTVQVIGFLRQLFLAAEVGIDSSLDAVLISLALPMTLVGVLAGGVSVAIVPAYAQIKDERGPEAARRLVGTVLVWVGLAGLALSVATWVFAEPIVAITAPGLADAGTADAAVRYLRAFAPLTLLGSISALLAATCQVERLFPPMALATVAGSTVALGILVLFWDSMGLDGMVAGALVGEVVGLVILLAATMVRRVAPLPHLVSRGLGLRDLARHAAPLTLSRALLDVQRVFDRAIASLLLPGGVSALRYGDSLVRLPFAAIRPAYQTAIYPTLVQASRGAGLGATTERLLRFAIVFFVPLAGLTAAVAPVATALLYDRGSFSDADLALTASIVAVSAPLIVTWTVQPTLVSALNAQRRGMILLAAGTMTMTVNIVLDVILGLMFGVIGIPMATVVASILVVVFMGRRLVRIEPSLSLHRVWRTFLKASLAILPSALIFGLPIWFGAIDGGSAQQALTLAVVGMVSLASYYLIARRLGLEEAGSIIAFAVSTLRRVIAR